MDITGKVIKVLPVDKTEKDVNGEKKVYYAQLTIIEINDGRYTRNVCLRAFGQDTINKCQAQVGETITASFDISSRSFTDRNNKERWSTELNMWRMQHGQQQSQQAPYQQAPQGYTPQPQGYAPQGYAPQAPQGYVPPTQSPYPPQAQPAYQPQMPFPPADPNDHPF